jgi:hypothetical protein
LSFSKYDFMDGRIRHLTSFAVLSLLSILLATGFVGESEGQKSVGRGANDYGSATQGIVCGDRLCSETGGKILMPWQEKSKETAQQDCLSSSDEATCQDTEDTQIEEKTINDITQEMEEMKNSLEANVTTNGDVLLLAKANVPVTIPLHQGYYLGKAVYYIITDSSDSTLADVITTNQDWKVNHAPLLANATKDAVSKTYVFTNGVLGDGVYGFQGEIFTSTPEHEDEYSALTSHVNVTWNDGALRIILDSENEMLIAEKLGKIVLSEQDFVLNMPQIVWPEGQMAVKANKTITDETTFVGGQIIDIDLTNKTTTFIAHQGWNSNGKQIFFIVTDATPIGPAKSMGILNVQKNAALISNPAAIDMFHFMNGIQGPGPLGFQSGISSSFLGDANYSPMSRIYFIEWSDQNSISIVQTTKEIHELEESGLIRVDLARPMNADHIVNSPIIDPIQLGQMK